MFPILTFDINYLILLHRWQNSDSEILKRFLNHGCSWVKHVDKLYVSIYVHGQRIACLAQQSSRGLAPVVQSIPPPRKSRQRSRLNVVKQTRHIITTQFDQATLTLKLNIYKHLLFYRSLNN